MELQNGTKVKLQKVGPNPHHKILGESKNDAHPMSNLSSSYQTTSRSNRTFNTPNQVEFLRPTY